MVDIKVCTNDPNIVYLNCYESVTEVDVNHVLDFFSYHSIASELNIIVGLEENAIISDMKSLVKTAKNVSNYHKFVKELIVFGMNKDQNQLFSIFLMLGPDTKIEYKVMPNKRKTEEELDIDLENHFQHILESDLMFH